MRPLKEKVSITLDSDVVQRIKELADKKNVTMGEIAMAWLLSREGMAAPIVGVTKINHLEGLMREYFDIDSDTPDDDDDVEVDENGNYSYIQPEQVHLHWIDCY